MAPNLLTNHLRQQRDRIAGMLMPGAKIASQQRSLSPLLPGFGGQKFRLAARKMRAIDPAQLGYLRPENILQPLIGPVNEARSLLHLKSATQEDVSTTSWGQVETIFPRAAEPEAPSLSGELRQGSIIPRMALVPKPGQSIESFKEQIAQRPKTPPSPAEPQQSRIVPKSRLFSRIEEIATPKIPEDLPGGPPEEETIQRQADFKQEPAPELPQKPVAKEKIAPKGEPTSAPAPLVEAKNARAEALPSQPPAPQPAATPKAVAAPVPSDEAVPLPRAIPVPPQKPAPVEHVLPRATPAQKRPQVSALPVTPSPTQKPVIKAKPTGQKAAPSSKPKVAPKAKAPQTPVSQPTHVDATPALRPAPDLPTPIEEPSEPKLFTPPALPVAAKPAPETGPATVSAPEITPLDEMPLRKQAAYRKQSPSKLKTLTPQKVSPKIETPPLAHPKKSLIPRQKYHPAAPAVIARQPDEHPLSDLLPLSEGQMVLEKPQPATRPQAQHAEPESAQPTFVSSTEPVPMALAYPPRRIEQAEQTPSTPPPSPAKPTVKAPVETAPQKPTPHALETPSPPVVRPASVQNVVQRKWPENESSPSSSISSSGQATEQSGTGQAQPDFDLAQLAEDVFPYVKRLIEIESDRISSRFR